MLVINPITFFIACEDKIFGVYINYTKNYERDLKHEIEGKINEIFAHLCSTVVMISSVVYNHSRTFPKELKSRY